MSDAKRLTHADVTQAVRDTRCSPSFAEEVRATVEALEKAEAENESHRAAQAGVYLALGRGESDRSNWPDAIRALREAIGRLESDLDVTLQRAFRAEAERDEWRRRCLANMGDERDGARAMVAQRWEALETRAAIAGDNSLTVERGPKGGAA